MDSMDDLHDALDQPSEHEISEFVDFDAVPKRANYTVLSRESLRLRIEGLIDQVSTALSVPRNESTVLLFHFRFQVKDLIDAWRTDEAKIREKLAFLMGTELDFSIQEDLLIGSYVDNNRNIKWCPIPGCKHAVESCGGAFSDVSCVCSNTLCWNCSGEAHRPVDCATFKKWTAEISPETRSMNQILLCFKLCPKCKQPIDISTKFRHFMLCPSPCNYQFCWKCLKGWEEFHDPFGGCKMPNNETVEQAEALRAAANRYLPYLDRWEAYEASEERAVAALEKVKNERGMDFLVRAWEQIRSCRRVLKWRQVLLYFLSGNDKCNKKRDKLWRDEAEKALRKLHFHVKKCTVEIFDESEEFYQLRRRIIELTIRTKSCFENLVYALENHWSEVNGKSLVPENVLKKLCQEND